MVKGIYVLLTMFLLIGCATVMNPYKMDNRMHKIELGMTKQKVISILGKDFESAGARITPDGPIESISYKTVTMTIADYSEGLLHPKLQEWDTSGVVQGKDTDQ